MPTCKLSEAVIAKLPKKETETVFYFDEKTTGFGVYVTPKGVKTYFVKRRVNGKQVKTAIEKCNLISLDDARTKAEKILVGMKEGINPVIAKKEKLATEKSFSEYFKEYLDAKNLKVNTVTTYEKLFNYHLPDWLNISMANITREMVHDRFIKISNSKPAKKKKDAVDGNEEKKVEVVAIKNTEKMMKAPANNVMRTFSGIYNFARAKYKRLLPENPVNILSDLGMWHKIERRKTMIKYDDLPVWLEAVAALENPYFKNYFLLTLFTGIRREECASLEWANVDFTAKTIKVVDTKNHKMHIVYMTDKIVCIMEELKKIRVKGNPYVFPSSRIDGHIYAPVHIVKKIKADTGINFCIHDLRREFSTIAEENVTVSVLKNFLNHSTGNDVTMGYIILQPENLKKSMQKVSDAIVELSVNKNDDTTQNIIDNPKS